MCKVMARNVFEGNISAHYPGLQPKKAVALELFEYAFIIPWSCLQGSLTDPMASKQSRYATRNIMRETL